MITDSDRWLDLDLRQLTALRTIANAGSFHRAAEQLGYTQSAVSQQIAGLERIVGTRLIHRPGGPRPISLTEAGRLLLRHADAILARLHAAEADLSALAAGTAGCLRVGTYQSVGRRILPALMRQLATTWPQLEIRLVESATDRELLPLVERGELDLTFSLLPLPEGPFASVELLSDPYALIVPADSPLAGRTPDLRELVDLPLIGFRQCRSLEIVEERLREQGLTLDPIFRSDDNGTVQALVATGMGVAFIPRLAIEPGDPSIAVIDLAAQLPPRRIALAWHRDRYRTPAMCTFIEAVQAHCERMAQAAAGATAAA
ncbi:MAG TPA: LysR family transcriptional regulator [Chloroflexota bacterium]|nr:LysR family transcriptional regulator [Chloroflexota bacterium]